MISLIINLVVAAIWMLLQSEASLLVFVVGWSIGFFLLTLFRPIVGSGSYVRRTFGLVRFLVIFIRAFVFSSVQLMAISLFRPRSSLQPRVITYDVRGLSLAETLILSHSVSLTPGTTTIDVAPDRSRLVLHVLDAPDPERVRTEIDRTLRSAILAFTR